MLVSPHMNESGAGSTISPPKLDRLFLLILQEATLFSVSRRQNEQRDVLTRPARLTDRVDFRISRVGTWAWRRSRADGAVRGQALVLAQEKSR